MEYMELFVMESLKICEFSFISIKIGYSSVLFSSRSYFHSHHVAYSSSSREEVNISININTRNEIMHSNGNNDSFSRVSIRT